MKVILAIVISFISVFGYAQTHILDQYKKAESLLKENNYFQANKILGECEKECDKKDTLYSYIIWYYTNTLTQLEKEEIAKEEWNNSLRYGLEALKTIEKGENYFKGKYKARRYWVYKNIIVSYFGLNQLDSAKKYQDLLYQAYKDKVLPDGINQFYNFEFFKWDNKNIWAYEYYPELGDPETQGSFSKIEYYVYSTKPDGTDEEELYQLHVLKFHKVDDSTNFDYVLTKRLINATNEVSGTFYSYTYSKPIDYNKLRVDIREVLKGNYEPDTKSVIKRK